MSDDIEFTEEDDYILAKIPDLIITPKRAHEVLSRIGEECSNTRYNKVLLDERLVEKREVSSQQIMGLSRDLDNKGLKKIYIAFWCQPNLINKDSKMLSAFTYKNEYVIQHFSEKEKAEIWLSEKY